MTRTTALGTAVDYDHELSRPYHSVKGAVEVLRLLFPEDFPETVLDVGCGIGTWLKASLDCGARTVLGVDGVDLPAEQLLVAKTLVRTEDLNRPLRLDRRFELVLCLETVEHLEPESAETAVDSLVSHGDRILFSAAVPGQPGTHHVNCQWPAYWQHLFNDRGYVCDDFVRWLVWDNPTVEPWYRQNLMMVTRDEGQAGREPRIKPVLHPALQAEREWAFFEANVNSIEAGALSVQWYLTAPLKGLAAKLRRRFSRGRGEAMHSDPSA